MTEPNQKFAPKNLGKQAAAKVKKNNHRLDTDNFVKLETSPDHRDNAIFEKYSRLNQYRSEDFADRSNSIGKRKSVVSENASKKLGGRQGPRTNLYFGDGGFDDEQQQTGPVDIYGDLSRSPSGNKLPSFKKKK